MTSLKEPGRILAALCIAAVLTGSAEAQNLDQGKSGAKLFADGCVTCHRSPRGLARGRINLTLSWFLRQHYSSGPDSASALASYLQSVDSDQPRSAAKPWRAASRKSRSRSSAAVPGR